MEKKNKNKQSNTSHWNTNYTSIMLTLIQCRSDNPRGHGGAYVITLFENSLGRRWRAPWFSCISPPRFSRPYRRMPIRRVSRCRFSCQRRCSAGLLPWGWCIVSLNFEALFDRHDCGVEINFSSSSTHDSSRCEETVVAVNYPNCT